MSQFEIIGTPAMRVFKRYVMPFSVYSVSLTTLSNVEGEWVVRKLQINTYVITCYQKNGNKIMLPMASVRKKKRANYFLLPSVY